MYPPHPSTLFPGVGVVVSHGTLQEGSFPSLRQCQASACEIIFCRYSLQLLHPSFSSIHSHHSTSRRPLCSSGGFVRGFGRGGCGYFRRDCMGSEHVLGLFSFLNISASNSASQYFSALLPITTLRQRRVAYHDCEGRLGICWITVSLGASLAG